MRLSSCASTSIHRSFMTQPTQTLSSSSLIPTVSIPEHYTHARHSWNGAMSHEEHKHEHAKGKGVSKRDVAVCVVAVCGLRSVPQP